jgi:hypothetical protein
VPVPSPAITPSARSAIEILAPRSVFVRLNSSLKNSAFDAPKGAPQFKELTASLKRCPDTKLEFFTQTVKPEPTVKYVRLDHLDGTAEAMPFPFTSPSTSTQELL